MSLLFDHLLSDVLYTKGMYLYPMKRKTPPLNKGFLLCPNYFVICVFGWAKRPLCKGKNLSNSGIKLLPAPSQSWGAINSPKVGWA